MYSESCFKITLFSFCKANVIVGLKVAPKPGKFRFDPELPENFTGNFASEALILDEQNFSPKYHLIQAKHSGRFYNKALGNQSKANLQNCF